MEKNLSAIIGKACVFTKTFEACGTFGAVNNAEKWLKERGYIYAPMCRDEPRGVAKADNCDYIAKWYNISLKERNLLDGVMVSEDFREGSVTVLLSVKEE